MPQPVMHTLDEASTVAPVDVAFQHAADVERWPEILPHYRWVRFREKRGFADGVVEMAAYRHFGPLPYPTWWVSEMSHDPQEKRIRYRHVEGITKGMDVVWEVRETPDGGAHLAIVHEWDGPGWPLISTFAARHVIGPRFVSHIAGRTLAGVIEAAEGEVGDVKPTRRRDPRRQVDR